MSNLKSYLIGQDEAINQIERTLALIRSGLMLGPRPPAIFLFSGPSGCGKTRAAEAMARELHGNPENIVLINCGEYQMDHEVAKLVGAPPGYLGHRETQPALTQARLNAVTSEKSPISIVLFDEVEKAAQSMQRILLGVLDKGVLSLGDNNKVKFDRTIVLMTSNLGLRDWTESYNPNMGFGVGQRSDIGGYVTRAIRKHFSQEFINRIDRTICFRPLTQVALEEIFELEVKELCGKFLGKVEINFSPETKGEIVGAALNPEFGGREIKRQLRFVMEEIALAANDGEIPEYDKKAGRWFDVTLNVSGKLGEFKISCPKKVGFFRARVAGNQ